MKNALKTAFLALVCAGSSLFAPLAKAQSLWSDPAYVQRQADLSVARVAGLAAQQAVVAARDSAALTSATCTSLDDARRLAAEAYVTRGQPPDPSRIIQNTTCFLDVAATQIPVALTGIGFLDGLINGFLSRMINGACSQLSSYIGDLKNSAMSQISGAVSSATGGSLSLSQLSNPNVTVNVGGQNITLNENTNVGQVLQIAGNTAINQAVNAAVANIGQSTYDAINGTMDPNANLASLNALNEYKAIQCQVSGVGANDTCPCPTPESLAGVGQSVYPQCANTYVPWVGGVVGGIGGIGGIVGGSAGGN